MAFGDFLIRLKVPPQPQGSTETAAEYLQKVKDAVDARLDATGINPARFAWIHRSDLPTDRSAAPAYVQTRLGDTSVDTGDYNFTLDSSEAVYCIVNGELRLYAAVSITPDDQHTGQNDFLVDVALNNNLEVQVPILLVVMSTETFPGTS